eukprot:CAMPEP_0201927244 /NCGR_PEP_ID=MMETSP0903-20130614/18237_1 /ASSEMBLY_ACC=CAM_ASM_000552 /TAXON_ID=420261 /ORGANISM="Thalassiosira antarctica, Strain CCMP982" /LENGTH=146 /DNA_ID=CAMNT_0048465379 /DNA_START=70 /DNA_END=506 /DNA_ORIENTATION=+
MEMSTKPITPGATKQVDLLDGGSANTGSELAWFSFHGATGLGVVGDDVDSISTITGLTVGDAVDSMITMTGLAVDSAGEDVGQEIGEGLGRATSCVGEDVIGKPMVGATPDVGEDDVRERVVGTDDALPEVVSLEVGTDDELVRGV